MLLIYSDAAYPQTNMANPSLDQQATNVIKFKLHSADRYQLEVKYFSKQTSSRYWPADGSRYLLDQVIENTLSCKTGEKVCFGAWRGKQHVEWGTGRNNDLACENCCATCGESLETTLKDGGVDAGPPPAVFLIHNKDKYSLRAKFFSQTKKGRTWPESNKYYDLAGTQTYKLTCEAGEKICYGAWRDGQNVEWGTGRSGDNGCQNCCTTCGELLEATINDGGPDAAPPPAIFTIHNKDKYSLRARFFSQSRKDYAWPSATKYYDVAGTQTYKLNCEAGEKICYGAWRDGQDVNWGAGRTGDQGCENCCTTCGGMLETTLGDGGPDAGPPPAVFILHSNDRYRLQTKFYSQNNKGRAWPGASKHYDLAGTQKYKLDCEAGEKICYGAWRDGQDVEWGTGRIDDKSCQNCCTTCGGTLEATLGDGGPDAGPPPAVFILHNNDRYILGVEFSSQTRQNQKWPGNNQQYNLTRNQTFKLRCERGEKICFGAWRDHQTYYYGVGRNNSQGCENCCIVCGGRLETTFNDAGPDSMMRSGGGGGGGGGSGGGSGGGDTNSGISGSSVLSAAVSVLGAFAGIASHSGGGRISAPPAVRTYSPNSRPAYPYGTATRPSGNSDYRSSGISGTK